MGIGNIVFVVFSNYCQIFDICLFLCSWKSVCGAKHSFSSQIHALLFFFSSSDRIVNSVFLYTLALLKGRHSDQVFFFYKRFESNTENCSKYLYCPHCIHSPCMTVILCFWYFSFSWICIYYWFSLKCFFSRWSLSTMYDFWCICFIFLKFKSYIYSWYLHKPFDTSQNSSQWIEF